jgi:zinc/manganese transport system substrate-binding protein
VFPEPCRCPARRTRAAQLSLAACLALAGPAALAACGAGPAGGTDFSHRVAVVAAENVWGDIASQVGGSHVMVTSLITNPSADPHQYESDAADAAAVAGARVIVQNGLGYDDFMNDLENAGGGHPAVVSAQRALGLPAGANPHAWYDVPRVPAVAGAIEAALSRADPADAGIFRENLARFDESLGPLLSVIAEIRAKYSGAPVAYTERLPGYLLADAGLRVATPPGFALAVEDGAEPSLSDTQAMDALVTGRRVRLLLYNRQATSAVAERVRLLAEQAGVPVVALSETLPPHTCYQRWQLGQERAILGALGG